MRSSSLSSLPLAKRDVSSARNVVRRHERQQRLDVARFVADGGDVGDPPNRAAVTAQVLLFDDVAATTPNDQLPLLVTLRARARVSDIIHRECKELWLRMSEHLAQAAIRGEQTTAHVRLSDPDYLLLEQRTERSFAATRKGFGRRARHLAPECTMVPEPPVPRWGTRETICLGS